MGFQLKFLRKIRSERAMTMVEVVCSLALLALTAVFVCSVCLFVMRMLTGSAMKSASTMKTAGAVEQAADGGTQSVGTSSGTFSITFGGQTVSAAGRYLEDSEYKTFVPDSSN